MKFKRSRFHLTIVFVVIGVLAVTLAIGRFVKRQAALSSARNEAVWLARYLNSANGDYAAAVLQLKQDRPIDPAFVENWESVSIPESPFPTIIARRNRVGTVVLVITEDYMIASRAPDAFQETLSIGD